MMREAIPGATSQGTLVTLEARRGGRDPPRWVSGGTAACPGRPAFWPPDQEGELVCGTLFRPLWDQEAAHATLTWASGSEHVHTIGSSVIGCKVEGVGACEGVGATPHPCRRPSARWL